MVTILALTMTACSSMKKNEEGCVNFCLTSPKKGLRRQEVVPFFIPNGALYLASTKHFKHSFFTERTLFFEMNKESSVDIDTMEDLQDDTYL